MAGTTSAGQPRRSGSGGSSIEAGLEQLLEPALLAAAATLAIAAVLPLLLIGVPVFLALYGLRMRSWRWKGPVLLLCVVPALAALSVAYVSRDAPPGDVVLDYVAVQLDAVADGLRAVESGGVFDW